MASEKINMHIPKALLESVDALAQKLYMTRSEYIRAAIVRQTMSDEVNITPEALLSHKEAQRLQAVKFYKKQDKEIRASGGYKEIY